MGYHLGKINNTDWRGTWTVKKKPKNVNRQWANPENNNRPIGSEDNEI